MAVPDYQSIMLPLLQHVADGKVHTLRDLTETLASFFKLSEEEKREMLPSGAQFTFANRVGWARTYRRRPAYWTRPSVVRPRSPSVAWMS